jgi:hypothetical protein
LLKNEGTLLLLSLKLAIKEHCLQDFLEGKKTSRKKNEKRGFVSQASLECFAMKRCSRYP